MCSSCSCFGNARFEPRIADVARIDRKTGSRRRTVSALCLASVVAYVRTHWMFARRDAVLAFFAVLAESAQVLRNEAALAGVIAFALSATVTAVSTGSGFGPTTGLCGLVAAPAVGASAQNVSTAIADTGSRR